MNEPHGRRALADERRRIADERRRRGRDVPWRRGLRMARRGLGRLVTHGALPAAIGALSRSWRIERVGAEHFEDVTTGGVYVAVMWHGRMLLPLRAHARRGIGVLVSPSGDGELVARVLRRAGYVVIRGSSSRFGTRALRDMREHLLAGTPVVVTPDGPRGPRHAINVGAAWLARETGAPILPVACACDRAWRLSSWDRFTIPNPGARVLLDYGVPIRVPRAADDAALEAVSAGLRDDVLRREVAGFARLATVPDL